MEKVESSVLDTAVTVDTAIKVDSPIRAKE